MSYTNFPKLAKKRTELMKTLEEKSYEGDRSAKDYQMEEVKPTNYPKVELINGLYPEEIYHE